MTTRHVPGTGRHQQLTRLPDPPDAVQRAPHVYRTYSILEANGYTISEVGKSPDFVLDVAPKRTGQRDYACNRDNYAAYGVREQWRLDYTSRRYHDAPLSCDRLVNDDHVPLPVLTGPDGVVRGYSEALGLDLHWDRATEEYLPDLTEAVID